MLSPSTLSIEKLGGLNKAEYHSLAKAGRYAGIELENHRRPGGSKALTAFRRPAQVPK